MTTTQEEQDDGIDWESRITPLAKERGRLFDFFMSFRDGDRLSSEEVADICHAGTAVFRRAGMPTMTRKVGEPPPYTALYYAVLKQSNQESVNHFLENHPEYADEYHREFPAEREPER